MRGAEALVLLSVASCSTPPARAVGAQRQALALNPTVVGLTTGEQLGFSVASCPTGGFAAGGPGTFTTLLWGPAGVDTLTTQVPTGTVVACETSEPRAFTCGSGGLLSLGPDGFDNLGRRGACAALAAAHRPGLPLLAVMPISLTPAEVWLFDPAGDGGTRSASLGLSASPRAGFSLAWHPERPVFAVGDTGARRVSLVEFAGGLTTPGPSIEAPAASTSVDFGWQVTFGDVHPAPGLEIIVAAPTTGEVFVFNLGRPDPFLYVLTAVPDAGFGMALAVEPGDAGGGLSALWVGAPGINSLYRFVGDAGEVVTVQSSDTDLFGISLAVETPPRLVIGAPGYASNGAVFEAAFAELIDSGVLIGVQQECTVGIPCSLGGCVRGTCQGGVLCVAAAPLCALRACVNDVCTTDDGGVDAGTAPTDAGGQSDAGDDHERQYVFVTSGCQASAAGPLLALGLALARRRKPGVARVGGCAGADASAAPPRCQSPKMTAGAYSRG